jgi:pimeloyl-ACP methyl ester carboxylesterase
VGFGATTVADTRRDASVAEMAQRLIATVGGPFVLVGVSMGGYIALEVVRQAPERVLALALLSTSGTGPRSDHHWCAPFDLPRLLCAEIGGDRNC